MAFNLVDEIVSLIPINVINGKDVSKTILVDTNENPVFMKNRAVLRTAEKRFDVHGDNGQLSFSIPLNDFDDTEILAAIASINASITALESDVAEAGTTANNAKAQSELNKEDIVTLTTTANAADSLSKSNQSNLNELSITVGGNSAAISANAKGIETNITAIASKVDQGEHDSLVTAVGNKADQSSLDSVSATASAADTLSKTNQGDIASITSTIGDIETEVLTTKQIAQKAEQDVSTLGSTVGSNTSQISANASAISSNTTDIASKASQSSLDAVSATATAADTLSKSNASGITGLNSAVDNNTSSISGLSQTVGSNTSQISSNTSAIASNTSSIASKASQSDLNAVSATATAADTLSKSNASSITGLNSAVDNNTASITGNTSDIASLGQTVGSNTSQIAANTKSSSDNATAIAGKASQADLNAVSAKANAADTLSKSNASSITGLNTAVDNNTAAIATKASQTELDTVKGTAGAADARSQSNEAKLAGKVSTDSNASVNNLTVKNNIYMSDGAGFVTGLTDAASALDAMNKRSVEKITNALSTRIDNVEAGAGDESEYILVHSLEGLITYDDPILKTRLEQLDGDTQCHIALNEIRSSRPVANRSEVRWIMREYIHDDHVIWNFAPKTGIASKDGILVIQHTEDEGCVITITTESTILAKQLRYNFGTGNNGRRNDWQLWQPKIKGYEGFNKGQILTDSDITWSYSANIRTNMQRLRDAIPNGCCFIGWHNHQSSDNKYRVVAKGNSSNIEATSGVYYLFKHGGTSSTGGFYVNSASGAEGWTRVYLGSSNAWASFGKQDNRSTATRFEGVDKVTIPFYEDPPELNLYVIASFTNDLVQTKAIDDDGEYESVGRYGVQWDGTWTRDEAYHTAYYRQTSNTYIAYDYAEFKWRKFTAAKQHTFIGQQAVASSIALFSPRSQFPNENGVYVDFGDLNTLSYEQITQPTIVHDTASKNSTINFGAARWGYIEGGGVPDGGGEYPDDGFEPVPEIEE